MDINKDKYKLKESSYYKEEYPKKQIIIGNTKTKGMKHFEVWSNKISGKYKKTAAYTVLLNGKIYEHFDPKYYSEYLGSGDFDKEVIPIALENEGWLVKDFSNNLYNNWAGEVYERDAELYQKSWRGKIRWAPYTQIQTDSLIKLCNKLTEEFNIPKFVSPNNVQIKDFTEKKGIYYRSNNLKKTLDVSPAFNIEYFKTKIENNGKHK